jgi:hypothetical protein
MTQLCGLHANCRQHVNTAWAGETDEKPPPGTFANISQTEVYAAFKELVLGIFEEQVFRNEHRFKQTTFIQSNTIQVYFNLAGYFCMHATCFGL